MNLGLPEVILIFIVILFFAGPDKLPETGEALGKAFRSFRTALSGESPREKEEASAKKGSDQDPHDASGT